MSQKPSLPKGTRDFGPEQMAKRNYILNTIRGVFETYGFMPLETPAMENLSTLTGKYGDEGDQLLYRVLDSGEYTKDVKSNYSVKEISHTKDLFETFFTDVIGGILTNYPDKLNEYTIIEQNFNDKIKEGLRYINPYVSQNEKFMLADFLTENHHWIIVEIQDLFLRTTLFTEDGQINEKSLKHHLRQFRDTYINSVLTPLYFEYKINLILKEKTLTPYISSKGLKYDLTVPFARYVVMNRHELALPFKRYQIQPVWRADRPQKGRYREFFQCDADVIGTDSLICEAEIIMMMNTTLSQLKIDDFTIKLNNRKILTGITEAIGAPGKENDFCVAIDKLDKIGLEKVLEELKERGLSEEAINKVIPILELQGDFEQKIDALESILKDSEIGLKGLSELKQTIEYVETMDGDLSKVNFDITLARGLSYYTGAIFEIQINNVKIGSVSGGGRYDDLTGVFGMPDMSGVGFSFGVDRLYDVMEELNLFPAASLTSTKALIIHFDEASKTYGLGVAAALRKSGIKSEIYPDQAKIKKQFAYADKKNIPYTIIIGSEEIASNQLTLRNMESGEEDKLEIDKIIKKLSN